MRSEDKLTKILQSLQKTPPRFFEFLLFYNNFIIFRVLIFAEKKSDVDNIYEYLLLKGVDAASLHGGKGNYFLNNCFSINFFGCLDQKERHTGVDAFRRGEKDVLVATDIASKGLDFENIMHVINFDMPEDIENYGKFVISSIQI